MNTTTASWIDIGGIPEATITTHVDTARQLVLVSPSTLARMAAAIIAAEITGFEDAAAYAHDILATQVDATTGLHDVTEIAGGWDRWQEMLHEPVLAMPYTDANVAVEAIADIGIPAPLRQQHLGEPGDMGTTIFYSQLVDSRDEAGHYLAEASTLGLGVGAWPRLLTVVGHPHAAPWRLELVAVNSVQGEVLSAEYSAALGSLHLTILND